MPAINDTYTSLTNGVASNDEPLMDVPEQTVYPKGVEIYLHSSGSTGMPKSIPFSADFIRKIQYQGHHPNISNVSCQLLTCP
jgi:acyl-coenzyme A synthetase/AMP-(fatty) acid ligase